MNTCRICKAPRKIKRSTFSPFLTSVFDEFLKAVPEVRWRPSAHRCVRQDGGFCTFESGQALASSH